MSQNRGGRRNRGYQNSNRRINIGDKGKEILDKIDDNNVVVQQFRIYAAELDEKHDRYEKIVKMGRDITIESKRIIFLLHTIDKKSKQDLVLSEAKLRLDNVGKTLFKAIAIELENQDSYQYLGAYRSGLEEYIEAVTFYQYLQNIDGPLWNWRELEKTLTYEIADNTKAENTPPETKIIRTLMTPCEYVLGIADLTGELMRKCINNLGTGDIMGCYQTCNFVRNMYKGFLGCTSVSGVKDKELNRKLYTLKQSLQKMENVCYTIKVRGSEIPKHVLADVANEDCCDSDEGYQPY